MQLNSNLILQSYFKPLQISRMSICPNNSCIWVFYMGESEEDCRSTLLVDAYKIQCENCKHSPSDELKKKFQDCEHSFTLINSDKFGIKEEQDKPYSKYYCLECSLNIEQLGFSPESCNECERELKFCICDVTSDCEKCGEDVCDCKRCSLCGSKDCNCKNVSENVSSRTNEFRTNASFADTQEIFAYALMTFTLRSMEILGYKSVSRLS
jgi:hypothetical protein